MTYLTKISKPLWIASLLVFLGTSAAISETEPTPVYMNQYWINYFHASEDNGRFDDRSNCYSKDALMYLRCINPTEYGAKTGVDSYLIFGEWMVEYNHAEFIKALGQVLNFQYQGLGKAKSVGRLLYEFSIFQKISSHKVFNDTLPISVRLAIFLLARNSPVMVRQYQIGGTSSSIEIVSCMSDASSFCLYEHGTNRQIFSFPKHI